MDISSFPSIESRRELGGEGWVRNKQRIAFLGFILFFPGFLIYHYGIGVDWWRAFLGGLLSAATALVFTLSMLFFPRRLTLSNRMSALQLLIFGILALMILWPLCHMAFLPNQYMHKIIMESVVTVTLWTVVIFIGTWLPVDSKGIRRIEVISISVVMFVFSHAYYEGGFPAGPFLIFGNAVDGSFSSYQGVGRSLLVIGVVAAVARRPYTLRAIFVLFMSTLLMLSLGSRSHFFALSLVLVLHLILVIRRTGNWTLGITCFTLLLIAVTTSMTIFQESRAAEIFDLASSKSWGARIIANNRALDIIFEQPFLGAFGYHVWDPEGYPHNLLSAWTQYGLVGFMFFIFTLLVGFITSVSGYRRYKNNEPAWLLAIHMNLIAIVLAIGFEPIMSSMLPALAWGLTLRARYVESL